VLHDWDDGAALQILRCVRASASSETRLLVLDSVIGSDANSQQSKLLDLVMLALVNGRERTPDVWRQLLDQGGWRASSIESGLIEGRVATP
jgi:hypothetical protein